MWDRISAVDEYRTWWPWLRKFEAGDGLVVGAEWSCEVSPPLPYVVRFVVHIDAVDAGQFIESTVSGDIVGSARLTIEPGVRGSRARLVSALRPANPLLRGLGLVARPLVERGHDWVLDEGRRQFIDRAFD